MFYYKLFYFFYLCVKNNNKKSIKYFTTELIVIVNSRCITLWNVDDSWGLADCLRKNPTILGTKKIILWVMDYGHDRESPHHFYKGFYKGIIRV